MDGLSAARPKNRRAWDRVLAAETTRLAIFVCQTTTAKHDHFSGFAPISAPRAYSCSRRISPRRRGEARRRSGLTMTLAKTVYPHGREGKRFWVEDGRGCRMPGCHRFSDSNVSASELRDPANSSIDRGGLMKHRPTRRRGSIRFVNTRFSRVARLNNCVVQLRRRRFIGRRSDGGCKARPTSGGPFPVRGGGGPRPTSLRSRSGPVGAELRLPELRSASPRSPPRTNIGDVPTGTQHGTRPTSLRCGTRMGRSRNARAFRATEDDRREFATPLSGDGKAHAETRRARRTDVGREARPTSGVAVNGGRWTVDGRPDGRRRRAANGRGGLRPHSPRSQSRTYRNAAIALRAAVRGWDCRSCAPVRRVPRAARCGTRLGLPELRPGSPRSSRCALRYAAGIAT